MTPILASDIVVSHIPRSASSSTYRLRWHGDAILTAKMKSLQHGRWLLQAFVADNHKAMLNAALPLEAHLAPLADLQPLKLAS